MLPKCCDILFMYCTTSTTISFTLLGHTTTSLLLPLKGLLPAPGLPMSCPTIDSLPLSLVVIKSYHFITMRLLATLAAIPLVYAATAQQPLQVYLHPTPTDLQSGSVPTLTPDQARAVLSHHLGENIGDFDEIPGDEGLWAHLMGMWNGRHSTNVPRKARVVIVDGGVQAQGESSSRITGRDNLEDMADSL